MRVPPALVQSIIVEEAQRAGVDPRLALAVAWQESGFDDEAIGDNGHSVGPFQENDRGRGAGRSFEDRADVRASARRFLAELAVTQRRTGTKGGRLAALTQRPADQAGYARNIDAML